FPGDLRFNRGGLFSLFCPRHFIAAWSGDLQLPNRFAATSWIRNEIHARLRRLCSSSARAYRPREGRAMNWRKALFDASPWLTTIGLFMVWEVVCRVFKIPPFIFPAPSQAVEALIEYWSGIWLNASHTFVTTLVGFAIAVVFGVALGVAVGASPLLYRALGPVLIGFNSIPKVAVVPILVLWFGIGTVPAVLTAFLVA